MLVLCKIEPVGDPFTTNFADKKSKFTAHPSLKCLNFTQYQHESKVKAVRVNGQINKVKQP